MNRLSRDIFLDLKEERRALVEEAATRNLRGFIPEAIGIRVINNSINFFIKDTIEDINIEGLFDINIRAKGYFPAPYTSLELAYYSTSVMSEYELTRLTYLGKVSEALSNDRKKVLLDEVNKAVVEVNEKIKDLLMSKVEDSYFT